MLMHALPSSMVSSTNSSGETEQHRHALWHRPGVHPTRWAGAAGAPHKVFSNASSVSTSPERSASTYNSPHARETCRTLIARLRR